MIVMTFPSGVTFFTTEDLDGIGGSKACELRLCCSSSFGGKSGLCSVGNTSGVCLFVSDEERNELLRRDSEGVPRKLILGEGTLLYRSIDCLYQVHGEY